MFYSNHAVSSSLVGKYDSGHPKFQTTRTPMGEALYQLKYKGVYDQANAIMSLIEGDEDLCAFIKDMDAIIPVPPSNRSRVWQPTLLIAEMLSAHFCIPCLSQVLMTANQEQVKNIDDHERAAVVRNAAIVNGDRLQGCGKCLIFDDVYASGSTLITYAQLLIEHGCSEVYALALTKTKG